MCLGLRLAKRNGNSFWMEMENSWACADSLHYLERKKYKLHIRVFLSRYRGYSTCPECRGTRLRLEARQVKINGKNICEVCAMTVEDAAKFFAGVQLSPEEAEIAERLLQEIRERLRFLNDVGLEYLTLDRLVVHAFWG